MPQATDRPMVNVHHLPCDPASVPEARRLASDAAPPSMAADQRAKLELAVTEIVANAVRHSGSQEELRLALTPKDGYFCVRVTDGGAGVVPAPGAMGSAPGAGFGLFIVERLTRRWGMTREHGKTRVWFELDYEPERTRPRDRADCRAAE